MKKMWKKSAAALVFAAVLIQGTTVQADVIWEPDDEFYQEERWKMGGER